jgi:uncharacterized protein (UPF0548 family)
MASASVALGVAAAGYGMIEVVPVTTMNAALASHLAAAELTYADVGATQGALPAGYHHLSDSRVIGSGQDTFRAAAAALLAWQVQLGAGLRVTASSAVAAPGEVVLLGAGAGPLRLRAPCRVVYTVTEARRRGFAYGTLPGHPERGEEAFMVEQRDDGRIVVSITAFSRPASLAARAAGPLGRLIQRYFTRRYLEALAEYADRSRQMS